jgi:hypothetical protein
VLVLGGGFAGLGAARKLEKADVDVVLVDANDYHSFQPMLYQLATGLIDTTAVAHSLRDLFEHQKNARVHQATVTAVDLDKREVQFADMAPLQYDYLVVGLGAIVQFFGCKGAPEHARSRMRCGSGRASSSAGRPPIAIRRWSRTERSTSSSWAAARPGSKASARSVSCTAAASRRTTRRACPTGRA